jgi:hypothetical protein
LDPEPDPDPHHFADDKPKCMEYEHFFKGLSLNLEDIMDSDTDPQQGEKSDRIK